VSLLDLWPVTGRKHQLRKHLAALGHPMLLSVPGYVLGGDMGNATLYLTLPQGVSLAGAGCEDGSGVLAVGAPDAVPTRGPPGRGRTDRTDRTGRTGQGLGHGGGRQTTRRQEGGDSVGRGVSTGDPLVD
jgi:hypothetical protein